MYKAYKMTTTPVKLLLSQFPDVMTDRVGCTNVVKCENDTFGP
jgi:hypothetical protein